MKKNIILFDMDNTLLLGDTVALWAQFLDQKGMMSDSDWQKRRQFDKDYIEQRLDIPASFEFDFSLMKKIPPEKRVPWRSEFFDSLIKMRISRIGLQLIQAYKNNPHNIVILITATHRFLASPTAEYSGVHHLISTEAEIKEDYTGRTLGVINMGEGKVKNLQSWISQHKLEPDYTVLYSDSINDLPLLSSVKKPIAVDPDRRLKAVALEKNWDIISFRGNDEEGKNIDIAIPATL